MDRPGGDPGRGADDCQRRGSSEKPPVLPVVRRKALDKEGEATQKNMVVLSPSEESGGSTTGGGNTVGGEVEEGRTSRSNKYSQ